MELCPPIVEHLAHEMLASETLHELVFLHDHLNRLEGFLMPLFNGDPHFVVAESLENIDKALKGAMAFLVKFAVTEKFIHRHLLARLERVLQHLEEDFGDKQLVVVSVVVVHL